MMNPQIKQDWLAALRSGEYPQGTGRLLTKATECMRHDTYCCLGVLCRVADIPIRPDGVRWADGRDIDFRDLLKRTGLTHSEAEKVCHITTMNDSGKSFKEIARWLEKNCP